MAIARPLCVALALFVGCGAGASPPAPETAAPLEVAASEATAPAPADEVPAESTASPTPAEGVPAEEPATPTPAGEGSAEATPSPTPADEPASPTPSEPTPAAPVAAPAAPAPSLERIRELALRRRSAESRGSYRIGPGDLLETTVYKIADLNRKVRVDDDGSIDLPFLGKLRAEGLTAGELSAEIKRRLALEYLRDPQVDVFIKEHRSAQVAVTGAVAKPGLYPLIRRDLTILGALTEAGGLTKEAGASLEFIPAPLPGEPAPASGAARANRFAIDLTDLMRDGPGGLYDFPVVAGDVIYVGEGGQFAIEGWVDKPGTYDLSRGMTVLSAISAGGGPLLPAKLSAVEVIREASVSGGTRATQTIDLSAVRAGEAADVKLLAGDVVRVPARAVLVPPWAVFKAVSELIRFGASVAVF